MKRTVVSPTSDLLIPFLSQMPGSDGLSYILDTWGGFFCLRVQEDGDGKGKLLDRPVELLASLSWVYLCCREDCPLPGTREPHVSYGITHCL